MKNILFQINDMASAIFNRRERNQRNEELLGFAFSAIERKDSAAFAEALGKQMTIEQQSVILSTTVEHKNMDFFHQALKVCDAGHKKCFALLVAVKTNNLEALRVLAPISHSTQLYYAAKESVAKCSSSVEDDHSEQQRIISLQCFDELLRWTDPKHNQSSLLRTALLLNAADVIERLWGVSDLHAVANGAKVMSDLGRQNQEQYIDKLWEYAMPHNQYSAMSGAASKGHIELMKTLIARLGTVDGTSALVAAVAETQEECFDFLLPLSNPDRTWELLEDGLKYHKKHFNIAVSLEHFPLTKKLEEHRRVIQQRSVLTQAVEQNNSDTAPASKRRL